VVSVDVDVCLGGFGGGRTLDGGGGPLVGSGGPPEGFDLGGIG
jgi:hypothetical protein